MAGRCSIVVVVVFGAPEMGVVEAVVASISGGGDAEGRGDTSSIMIPDASSSTMEEASDVKLSSGSSTRA